MCVCVWGGGGGGGLETLNILRMTLLETLDFVLSLGQPE